MTRFVRMSLLAGAFAVLSLAGQARADYLVTLTSTVGPTIANSTGTSLVVAGGTSTVTLAQYNGTTGDTGDAQLGTAASPINLTFGSTTTTRPTGTDAYNFGYGFTLTFTHGATSATATVGGTIAGSLSANGSTINNTYSSGMLNASTYTAITIGAQTLFVKLNSYTPPGTPPDVKNDFSVSVYAAVPEPGTIALLGVGGLVLLAPVLRRRVRRIAETA